MIFERTFSLGVILSLVVHVVHSQGANSLYPTIPTSPQGEAIQRYGDYSVNNWTGTPDISVPLYEINHRGYRIPLVLRYMPLPLKPGYNYDVFGHGWSLSLNSAITRNIEYLPDETRNFTLDNNFDADDYCIYVPGPGTCKSCLSGYDYGKDRFSVRLPDGSSFDFVIRREGNNLIYDVSEGRKVRIITTYDSYNIDQFVVIDEQGVKYTFADGDTAYPGSGSGNSKVSWMLTRIDLQSSVEPIYFNYGLEIRSDYNFMCYEPSIRIVDNMSWVQSPSNVTVYDPSRSITAETRGIGYGVSHKMKLLTSIEYGTSKVNLDYHAGNGPANQNSYNYVNAIRVLNGTTQVKKYEFLRTMKSITGPCTAQVPLAKLDAIVLKGSDQVEETRYGFQYHSSLYSFSGTDHWGNFNNSPVDVENSLANFNVFIGNLGDLSAGVPINSVYDLMFRRIPKDATDLCPYEKIKLSSQPVELLYQDTRRPADPSQQGLLSRITYPTNGYTDFEFEHHMFITATDINGNYIDNPAMRTNVIKGGGFRIKKISSHPLTGLPKVKTYQYGKLEPSNYHSGLGVAVADPNVLSYLDYSTFFESILIIGLNGQSLPPLVRNMVLGLDVNGINQNFQNPFNAPGNSGHVLNTMGVFWQYELVFSAANFRRLLNGRPAVVYEEITEYHGDFGDNNPSNTIGKSVFVYEVFNENVTEHLEFMDSLQYFGNVLGYTSKESKYNQLNGRLDYEWTGSAFRLTRTESLNYNTYSLEYFNYQYTNPYPENTCSVSMDNAYGMNVGTFNYEYYQSRAMELPHRLLSGKTIIDYDHSGSPFTKVETYFYDENFNMERKTLVDSRTRVVETVYDYPNDDSNDPVIQEMFTRNMVGLLLGSSENIAGEDVSGFNYEYATFPTGSSSSAILPVRSFVMNTSGQYELNDEVLSYTSNGNPVEVVGKDGVKRSYIWGYNDRYVIAEVLNATRDRVYYKPEEHNSGSFSFAGVFSPSSTANLKMSYKYWTGSQWVYSGIVNYNATISTPGTKIKEIRVFPEDASMTTYSYIPMVGLASQTDHNDLSVFYQYDAMGRLYQVKDNSGNIIKEYKYNYAY